MQTMKTWGGLGGGPSATHHTVAQWDEDYAPRQEYEPFQIQQPRERGPKRNIFWTAIWEWWLLEISCLTLSVAALVGIVILLDKYDNKPLKDWPWSISPNSVLAVFSTIIKTLALLPIADCIGQLKWTWFARGQPLPLLDFEIFDSASRGILGSIFLLFRLRFMHIASLGCIVTILAIAIDPLTQQALSQPTRSIPVPTGTATIPRAQNYSLSMDALQDGDDYISAPNSLIGAMYIGLYTPLDQEVAFPNPDCSTGNCTWTNYKSLGICQETKDVTKQRDSICSPCTGKNASATQSCHYACDMSTTFLNVSALRSQTLTRYSTEGLPENVSLSLGFEDIVWPVADVLMNYRNNFSSVGEKPDKSTSMYETVFYFCMQEFSSGEESGRPMTRMVNSTKRTTNRTVEAIGNRYTFMPQLTIHDDNTKEGETGEYTVEPEALLALSIAMYKAFQGGVSWADIITGTTEVGRVLGTIVDQSPKPTSRAQNDYTKIPEIMENVARALSNDLKIHPGNGTKVVVHDGTVLALESYISVTWPWLSLLFATVPLSILLLGLTMIRSANTHTTVWKTSSLPVLQILGQGVRGDLGKVEGIGKMEMRAEYVKVELEQRGGGWGLVSR
ncbi:uncharacterized protein BDR25DRAFT_253533 [Lindgomyces ingoldianus]|uniref:Uncharacterized protein n=1 Tax=Lindgomyces ingoldianus TaxID=673940 RepID=A0ACB6R9F1_9PLEO|nr:uncharacterized protein BDR25DRAFT_253533 [Lindgomyces ingoldianus]KAF2475904.1 hypothetical protein BDR25DRAFT_253533 [Lindgomyces ingoldianus]